MYPTPGTTTSFLNAKRWKFAGLNAGETVSVAAKSAILSGDSSLSNLIQAYHINNLAAPEVNILRVQRLDTTPHRDYGLAQRQ
jgi:hypothetical protein